MKIHFFGAAQTVTGSQYLIQLASGKQLLLECGLFQGKRQEAFERNRTMLFDARKVDAAILSHAHIDHSGNYPSLVRNGYTGMIYATRATTDLADIMLRDSGHIQEADAVYVNKKRAKQGLPPVEPLYTQEDAARVAEHLQPVEYNQPFEPLPGVTATLVEAGHILGSAAVILDIHENGQKVRLWFSGDIGRYEMPLLRDPVMPNNADYVLMECTYGDKPHPSPQPAFDEFRQVVLKTAQRGGKVIVPAFAVGRTQELVYALNQMLAAGELPAIPVYVDSPLAVNASEIFARHPECYDAEAHNFIRQNRHPALNFPTLTYIRSVDESKTLNDKKGPMVIISASGMAETGRILHHLRNNIEDPRNTIAIVSWQAPNTLGRRLAERERKVRIFGETFYRKAEVATIGGLSAHAGQDMLVKYARAAHPGVKKIILAHGEPRAALTFSDRLVQEGFDRPLYPGLGDILTLD